MTDDIVIVAAQRTAVGKFGGTLAKTPAPDLGAHVVKGLLAKGVPAKNLILVSRSPKELEAFAKQGMTEAFKSFFDSEEAKFDSFWRATVGTFSLHFDSL